MAASGKAQASGRRAIFVTGAAGGITLLNRIAPERVRTRLRKRTEAL